MRVIVALALFLCAACAQYNPRDGSRTVVRYVAPRPAEYVPQYPSSNPLVQFRVPGPYSAPAPPAPFEQRQPFSQYAVRPQAFSVPPTHYVPPAQFRDAAPAQPAFSVPPSFYAPPAPSQSQDSYATPDQDVPAEEAPAPAQANSGFSGALNFVQQAAGTVRVLLRCLWVRVARRVRWLRAWVERSRGFFLLFIFGRRRRQRWGELREPHRAAPHWRQLAPTSAAETSAAARVPRHVGRRPSFQSNGDGARRRQRRRCPRGRTARRTRAERLR